MRGEKTTAEKVHEIIGGICSRTYRRGLRLNEFFRDFDHLKHGDCPTSALNCIFTQLGLRLSKEDTETLVANYSLERGRRFNYRQFLSDCESSLGEMQPVVYQAPVTNRSAGKLETNRVAIEFGDEQVLQALPNVLKSLQAQVYERRVDFRAFFFDFDHLRKGFIPSNKFRSILSLLNFHMTEDEIQVICKHYRHTPDFLDYHRLCEDVEKDLICPPLEANPLGQPPPSFDLFAAKEGKKPSLTEPEQEIVLQAEERIRRKVHQRGMNLLPQLRSYDRYNRLVITDNQFRRALVSMGFEIPDSDLEVLLKKYCIHGSMSRFAYREFCSAIDA